MHQILTGWSCHYMVSHPMSAAAWNFADAWVSVPMVPDHPPGQKAGTMLWGIPIHQHIQRMALQHRSRPLAYQPGSAIPHVHSPCRRGIYKFHRLYTELAMVHYALT